MKKKTKALAKYIPVGSRGSGSGGIPDPPETFSGMNIDSRDIVKLARIRAKEKKQARDLAAITAFISSPLVQMIGTVGLTEYLEKQEILSSRWAGAIEGGIITMVGLQALKDFGVIGGAVIGGGLGIGALFGDDENSILSKANLNVSDVIGMSGGFPGAMWNLLGRIL